MINSPSEPPTNLNLASGDGERCRDAMQNGVNVDANYFLPILAPP
jgi:hypothetical protein